MKLFHKSGSMLAAATVLVIVLGTAQVASAGYLRLVPSQATVGQGVGSSVDFEIQLVADTPVVDFYNVETTIELDPAVFSVSQSSLFRDDFLTANGSDFTGIFSVTTSNGMLYVDFNQAATAQGASVTSGVQRLFGFTADIKSTAPLGPAPVNMIGLLTSAYQTLMTDVNGDTIPFSSGFAPTNGYDPGVDAVVNVTAVPEPASIALVGLGGLAMALSRRLRRRI